MSDDEAEDAPEQENTVASAAAAIEELMKKPRSFNSEVGPDDGEEDKGETPAPPDAAKAPQELEQKLGEAAQKAQEAETMRTRFAAALNNLVPQLETAIKGEFGDIKSPADLARLAHGDPARYNRYVTANAQLENAQRTRVGMALQQQQASAQRHAAWQEGEQKKVADLIPELKGKGGEALARKIQEFAAKSGYTPQQLAQASATDMAMLHRAMQYDSLSEAQAIARAKAAKAPPVQQPGTRSKGGGKHDTLEADFNRLKKSGRTEDAAAVFRNILS